MTTQPLPDEPAAMQEQPPDVAVLNLAPRAADADLMQKVEADIRRDRSKLENKVAWVLVIAIVASLPLMLLTIGIGTPVKTITPELYQAIFDRWLTLIGPLVGAAVGVGAISRSGGKGDGQ